MQFLLVLLLLAVVIHTQAKRLAGLTTSFCVLQGDGQNFCIGDNSMGSFGIGSAHGNVLTPTKMLNVVRGTDICAGNKHACIVDEGGQAKCAGYNANRELGSGTAIMSSYDLVQVFGLESGVREVFCGPTNTCAILDTGAALCWGENIDGQLGAGHISTLLGPSKVVGFETGNAKEISIGEDHICFLHVNGDLFCSGANVYYQLGDVSNIADVITPTKPKDLPADVKFQSVSCGFQHTCAVTAVEGAVYCWGSNFRGQLGTNGGMGSYAPQQAIGLSTGAATVWASSDSTYVLMQDGSAKAFGENAYGEFSIGTTTTRVLTPVDFDDNAVTNIVELRGGYMTTCILLSTGSVQCSGSNQRGQLGTGTTDVGSYYLVTLPMIAGLSPTAAPSVPSVMPTQSPTRPTRQPSKSPTHLPTDAFTHQPSQSPVKPSIKPTRRPSRGLYPEQSSSALPITTMNLLLVCILNLIFFV